jgi:outer membrane receptor protein involved in Fe transport
LAIPIAIAAAAEPDSSSPSFSITAKPVADALLDFALQAGISLGGAEACPGNSPGLRGRFGLAEGLKRLLDGAPCRFEFLDARTVKLVPAPVRTAATPPPPAPAPEEVLVTAAKRAVPANRLPAAVSIVPADQLDAGHDVDVADTLDHVAGMSTTNLGPARDKIMLRGLSDGTFTGRTQSTVATYLDGLPVNYNAPDPDLRLTDVESVEVLRGPQGALYGSGSLSGVYRIVTRKPDLDTYGADLSVSYGWTQAASSSRSADGMVNLPLVEGMAALRLVGYGDLEGGYLDNAPLRQSNVDRTTRDGGRASLEARLDDDWTIIVAGTRQMLDSADSQYTSGPRKRRANRVAESSQNDFSQGALTVAGSQEWGRLDSSTGYVHHAYASQYDASAALSVFDDTDASDIGLYDEATNIDLLVEDLVASSTDAGPLQWLAGFYAARTLESTARTLRARGKAHAPLLRYQGLRSDHQDELAPYGEASYDFGGGWIATAGARLFDTELGTSADIALPHNRLRRVRRNAVYRGWSPKVSLQWQTDASTMLYLLYSAGYRPGGFNAGGAAAPGQRVFSSDRLHNIETGAKSRLLDGAIELRSALFYDVWNDIQTDQYLRSGLSYTTNVGDARILGWESEVAIRPLSGLTLGLNDLLDSARLTGPSQSAALITSGLPGVPAFSFGATAGYEGPLDADLTLMLEGETSYVGPSRLTFQKALSPTMGGYFTSRLAAGVKTERWRLLAVLDNAADTQGDTFAFGNPFTFGQVRQVTPLRPRTLSLVLSANF